MKNKDLLKLLNNIKEDGNEPIQEENQDQERILIIDGLNLFLRNFAILNYINQSGVHIGGLGGFLRSLGSYIKQLQPTQIYVIFDGLASSTNRKNLVPEYKSGRHQTRITNHNSFSNLEEEHESKANQISRLIDYLKCLPINIICVDKVEADDIMAFLSEQTTQNPKSKAYIISADNDFLQLVNEQITIYRPVEKEFYTPSKVKEKFGVYPHNFLTYKTLIGDKSDKVGGVQGLGFGKLEKLFPELLSEEKITLEHIHDICSTRLDEHVIYARTLFKFDDLRKAHKIMNLENPMLDDLEKDHILNMIKTPAYKLDSSTFLKMYHEDGLGHVLKNVDYWIKECFDKIDRYNRSKNK